MRVIEVTAGADTFRVACPLAFPKLATMMDSPAESACTRPAEFTCAYPGAEDDQFKKVVALMTDPFPKVPVAVNCF